MTNPVKVVVATIFSLSHLMVSAQQPPSDAGPTAVQEKSQIETISVTSREVVLDVVALDAKGHSISGLKPSDFALLEDGVPQTIKDVSEHHAMSAADVAKVAPEAMLPNAFTNAVPQGNTNSVTVILLDALNSPLHAQMYLREELIAFMKKLPPGNTFAIFQMDDSMHLVQGFTSDRATLLQAVQSKRDRVIRPDFLAPGNKQLRQQIMTQGLKAMEQYLAAFPGRKNLVWFTAAVPHTVFGLSRNPFPDSVDYDNITERSANALSLSRIAVYPIDDRGLEVYAWNRASHEELDKIADATGGKAFYNNNGLREALTEIAETGSNYYTIAYSPTNTVWNAHHRDIELSVPGRKITLLYRHRYYARKERKAQRVADKRLAEGRPYVAEQVSQMTDAPVGPEVEAPADDAKQDFGDSMALGVAPSGELVFTVSATPRASVIKLKKAEPLPPNSYLREDLQRKPFRDYDLLYTVDPSRLSFSKWSDGRWHAEVEFVEVVYNAEGQMVNSLTSTSDFSCDQSTFLQERMNVRSEQWIEVPEKGNYFLRLGVHDTTSHLVGTLEIPVDTIRLGVVGPGQKPAP